MNLFKYLVTLLTKHERREELEVFMNDYASERLCLLWQIFFCTGISNVAVLEERIYRYGGLVKEQNYFEREMFVFLVDLLDFIRRK